MVLVQSTPGPSAFPRFASRIHPSPARIAGVAGAIALNAALFMLLLAPMGSDVPPPAPADDLIAVQIFEPVKPPDPPPPVPVPVTPPTPAPPVPRDTVVEPVEPAPVVFEHSSVMDLPALPPTEPAPTTAVAEATSAPVTGIRLEYASASPPPYPRRQLADRVEGQVLLRVLVDVDGKALEVTIQRSSGNRDLDRAAQQHILRNWTFRPAMKDGRAVQAIGLVPIDFKLQ
jgi:protein TonB